MIKVHLRRMFVHSGQLYVLLLKYCILFIALVSLGMFIIHQQIELDGSPENEEVELDPPIPSKTKNQFIKMLYDELGETYDNYCETEMPARVEKVNKLCNSYLITLKSANQKESKDNQKHQTFLDRITFNHDYDTMMIVTELSQAPNIENSELDANRKMMFCIPHKVGSQTWRHFYETLKIKDGINSTEIFKPKTSFPEDIQLYNKAYQVRHPFERLLSAYRFIFEREAMRSNIQDLKSDIMDKFPLKPREVEEAYYYLNSTKRIKKNIFDVIPNFRQFCEHVISSGNDFSISKYAVVSHWLPYYFSCSPCGRKFAPDVIIKMESILKDTLCYLDSIPSIDWEDVTKLHHVNQSPHGHTSDPTILKKYFSTVTKEMLYKLLERYQPDFDLYGYDIDYYLSLVD